MNKKLSFSLLQYTVGDFCSLLKNSVRSSVALVVMCFSAGSFSVVHAQSSVTVPSGSVSGSFLGAFSSVSRTYQMIIDDTLLSSLVGKKLTSVSFRQLPGSTAAWPTTEVTYSSYDILLSDGVDPANRQLNFALNVVGPQTTVKTGSLVIPAGAIVAGNEPDPFSFKIVFDTPYLYNGGNLVIQIQHGSSAGNGLSNHAVSTSTSGYGTLFTACWQGTGNVVQANFSYVKIDAQDQLGVNSVEIGSAQLVYPNPAKDVLNVNADIKVAQIYVYNASGQRVFEQKAASKSSQIDVSKWANGVYVIQIIDDKGNVRTSKLIKE